MTAPLYDPLLFAAHMTDRDASPLQPTPKRKHTAAHRAEFALARTLESTVSALPERAADAVGRSIGRAVHRLGIRRDIVESNLRLAFPDRDDRWIARTAFAAYEHLGREAAATMRLSKLDARAIVERTVPIGWDEMEAARSLGRGVILVTGHYGNWEIAAATVASRGIPIAAIVRRQGNRLVDERLQQLRKKLGVETIYQRQAPGEVPRILRANGVVGIVGDQNARRAGILVPFFGHPASTHRGPALFALRLGTPVLSCIARRMPGNEPRYEIAGERVEVERTGELDVDIHAMTAELAARLERQVRIAPEQYFWFHNRWKHSAPRS